MGWAESVQYFAGSNLSRHSEKRTDQAYIVERLTNPTSKFIAFDKEANALLTADKRSSTVAFLSYADVKPLLDLNTSTGLGSAFEANGFPVQWLFLGNDEGNSDVAYFGIDAAAPEDDDQSDTANARRGALKAVTECGFPSRGLRYLGFPETNVSLPLSPKPAIAKLPAGTAFHPFRPYSFLLPYHEAAVVGTGRAVLDWNKSSKFCPACGQKTVCEEAGWKRICPKPPAGTDRSKMCPARRSTQSYTHPRLDNSIIVAIVSADGERLFLGRKARSPPKFFSCVAGFQEPGESIEECVRREAREETGLRLSKVIYHSSQPWPMPAQLMIGCLAVVEGNEEFKPEEDEFVEGRWFSRDEIVPAIERARTGEASFLTPNADFPFLLPPPWAIAHFIIKAWALNEVNVLNFDGVGVTGAPSKI